VLNYVPMLARGGDDLLAMMRSAAREHADALVGSGQQSPGSVSSAPSHGPPSPAPAR
jgi:hypothetical protein